VVLSASPDPVAKVKRFHDKQELNFRLLADGTVAHAIPKVSPNTYDDEALAALAELSEKQHRGSRP